MTYGEIPRRRECGLGGMLKNLRGWMFKCISANVGERMYA